jgi:hypothetical protein
MLIMSVNYYTVTCCLYCILSLILTNDVVSQALKWFTETSDMIDELMRVSPYPFVLAEGQLR